MSARRLSGPSLTAQVVTLALGAVVAAQAVTILAVYLEPPKAPPTYSFVQVAAALAGQDLATDQGRRLRRTLTDEPPEATSNGPPTMDDERQLAEALHAPVDDVRVSRLRPPPFVMLIPGGPGRPPGGFRGPPPDRGGPFFPRGPERFGLRGEFVASWRRPDGQWIVVRPEPELDWLARLIVWIGGGLLIMGPVGFWFARRISAPLKVFAASAEALGRDPRAAPMALSGPAEVGVAARAFNAMQVRLQRYVGDRVSMVAAISHDLRTPLTRMRFKLEGADDGLRRSMLSDIAQMERMIDAVIAFSHDEAAPAARERLDLGSLVISVCDDVAATGADVEAAFDEPVVIEGDPVALQRLFANLIDNAVKYGGRARLSVTERGGEAVTIVEDDGPGMTPAELDQAFTPFYRSPAAQRRTAVGTGLGLTIARAAARAHGGEVVLRSTGSGLVAEVTLPLARA